MTPEEIEKLKSDYPNSQFIEGYDKCIKGVDKDSGSIQYGYYDMLYAYVYSRKDEFEGDDYEKSKADFTDEFQNFYDLIEEQFQMFDDFDNKSGKVPPTILEE